MPRFVHLVNVCLEARESRLRRSIHGWSALSWGLEGFPGRRGGV